MRMTKGLWTFHFCGTTPLNEVTDQFATLKLSHSQMLKLKNEYIIEALSLPIASYSVR